jgi:anti-anti-sigma factor
MRLDRDATPPRGIDRVTDVAGDLIEVKLIGLPVDRHQRAVAHQDALQREFDIIRTHLDAGAVPQRLAALMDELRTRFGGLTDQPNAELAAAVDRGDQFIDLRYHVPAAVGPALDRLMDIFDEADSFCRDGSALLTLATPAEAVTYRRWFLGQFVEQTAGRPPTPWAEFETREPAASAGSAPSRSTVASAVASAESEVRRGGLPPGWSTSTEGDRVVIRPVGEVDLAVAEALRGAIHEGRSSAASVVTVDLTAVTFLDSMGLSVLIGAEQRLSDDGREFQVVVPELLRPLFELSGVLDLFE